MQAGETAQEHNAAIGYDFQMKNPKREVARYA